MPFGSKNFQTQSNDFQTAENVLAQAELEGLPPETREVLQDMVDDLGFERRDAAAKNESKQHVLQGQLLVLGDPRNGKTSLIKAMTGEEFDPEEKQTSGVEFKFVDRKWKIVELQNMKFGDFNQYSEKSVCQMKFFPRLFNEDDPEEDFPFPLFVFLVVVLPIFLGPFLGEGNSRWWIYFVIMAWTFLNTCRGKGSVNTLLVIHFDFLATCIAYNLYGCSDNSVPMRLIGPFLSDLVTSKKLSLHVLNPWIFFVLELFSLVCTGPILDLLRFLFSKIPITGAILLNFVFRYKEEVLQPIGHFFVCLIFFAPIGLSCKRSSIIFPFKCVYIFLVHIVLLYHQNILRKKNTAVVIALELSIIIPLCFTGLEKVHIVLNIMANIILLGLELSLHIHGKWVEVKDEFKGKSFTQVVLNKDFLLHTIQINKALIDMQKLKNALNDKFCTLKLRILDFAGDEEYYAYHQIFLNSNALYVVVFNIQDFSNNDFKDPDCKLSKRLRFWLESIHSHVLQGTPIFLVGTHRADIPKETLRVIDSCIRKAVWYMPFNDDIVVNKEDGLIFFHVENSKGLTDKGVVKLREKIKSIAENELKDVIGQEIPLSWIKIQDAIIRYTEQKLGPVCVTVEDFKKKFEHLYIAWDDEMLKYFHKRGFIIYVDNDPDL